MSPIPRTATEVAAPTPGKENVAAHLDREIGCSRGIAEEIASVTNKLRECLIGPAPPSDPTGKAPAVGSGILGEWSHRQGETNKILAYILDDLRTVLNEIS